ncbi:hypothetical protein LEP1GSC017_0321 [Leptospira meyeri serovar Hardjo str. Went 5]|nr:hypothetical protein LEP1GSC017_0321 [Leptospira meyeri serovar Hardjo str. Went 5]EMJ87662.1 hypothetical protein LEP1GSC196_0469 [Leptospira meyeri serovar Semaranga str. Veldrot Semarang 173]
MVWCVFSTGIFDELGFIKESKKSKSLGWEWFLYFLFIPFGR